MDTCCCAPAERAAASATCQSCGAKGSAVSGATVQALLTVTALQRFRPTNYRFCANATCATVYFAADGQTFTTADVRVPVCQKQPFGARIVCYCFGETEADMRREIEQRGASAAVQRVRAHIAAGRCACEVRNPKGACCLGDVTAAVKRVAAVLQPTP
jgi:hypothetical protein